MEIQEYYDNTEAKMPRKNVKYFIENFETIPENAIELGCGAGNDTAYLIKKVGMLQQLIEKMQKKELKKDGYFVGNFFGNNDEWAKTKKDMTFLTKEEVLDLFEEFEIKNFKEIEKNGMTGMGKIKYWHTFNVIAQKNKIKETNY